MHDTTTHYGAVTRGLHGLIAGLVFAQFGSVIAKKLWGKENFVTDLLGPFHGDIGILILALVFTRVAWAIRQRRHRPQPTENRVLVKVGHTSLYLLMLLVPALGLVIPFSGGHGADLFGFQFLPAGIELQALKDLGKGLHKPLAWAFFALVFMHVAVALYHRYVRKDQVMNRMFGRSA